MDVSGLTNQLTEINNIISQNLAETGELPYNDSQLMSLKLKNKAIRNTFKSYKELIKLMKIFICS